MELTVEMMSTVIAQLSPKPLTPVVADCNLAQPVVVEGSEQSEVAVSAPVRSTRAQVISEQSRDWADELASAQSDCIPVPLSDVLDFPDSYFENDPVVTPVAELCTWPAVDSVDFPLPDVSDKGKLAAEQTADKTLEHVHSLARKVEKGYRYEDGVTRLTVLVIVVRELLCLVVEDH